MLEKYKKLKPIIKRLLKAEKGRGYLVMITDWDYEGKLNHTNFRENMKDLDVKKSLEEHKKLIK